MATHPSQQTAASRPEQSVHTPGPWTYDVYGGIAAANGILVAEEVLQSGHPDDYMLPREEQEANARLIAAAPDMLAALNKCDAAFVAWQVGQIPGRPEDILALITEVRAAIAKAEGR